MRWLSRRYRNAGAARLAITVAPSASTSIALLRDDEQWQRAFSCLNIRQIPATWAVVDGCAQWPLGSELVASSVAHELAYLHDGPATNFAKSNLQTQALLAQQVGIDLRTLVTATHGVHPALLAHVGARVVVPMGERKLSRTSSLRALAWDVWEAPITDRCAHARVLATLLERLETAVRESLDLHLLLQLPGRSTVDLTAEMTPLFDRVSDYHARGWIHTETVGDSAERWSRAMRARVA